MGKVQKRRAKKTSSGNGMKHRRTTLDPVQKVLLGGGMLRGLPKRWAISK